MPTLKRPPKPSEKMAGMSTYRFKVQDEGLFAQVKNDHSMCRLAAFRRRRRTYCSLVPCKSCGAAGDTENPCPITGGAIMARRAKAVHPTQIAPITAKIICHLVDGILSSAKPCVAL